MIEKIWIAIKNFVINHVEHGWLEQHFLYFALAIFFISLILWIIINKREIKRLDKQKRKIEKNILKLLSKFKNKI